VKIENQRLRDENNRLKGEQGKLKICGNKECGKDKDLIKECLGIIPAKV